MSEEIIYTEEQFCRFKGVVTSIEGIPGSDNYSSSTEELHVGQTVNVDIPDGMDVTIDNPETGQVLTVRICVERGDD